MFRIRRGIWATALLSISILLAFHYAVECDFVNFDDNLYVSENPNIRDGLTWEGIRWAFSADLLFQSKNSDYWQPLTFLTRMFDMQLYGTNAAGHHATNLILHLLNALLLLHLLNRMTGSFWASAFATALFALHPLRVEAVVWVTSRKDVLSTFFALLALEAHVSYARRPTRLRKTVVVSMVALGLMSKPMLVTLPLLMLLLDLWPLNRRDLSWREAFLEKWVLFLMCGAAGAVTLFLGHPMAFDDVPTRLQLLNVPVAYVRYILMWLWPTGLACYYTFPFELLETWRIAGSALALGGFSIFAIRRFSASPHLAVGWFWFLLTLLPVIGLENGGVADRFSYVPHIGLSILVAWFAAEQLKKFPALRGAAALGAAGLFAAMSVTTDAQVRHWKDPTSLFEHARSVTKGNWIAEAGLGNALIRQGKLAEALPYFEETIRLQPRYSLAHFNIGVVLESMGKPDAAVEHYAQAIRLSDLSMAHNNLGILMENRGDTGRAIAHYREAVKTDPFYAEARNNLGRALAGLGHLEEAIEHFKIGVKIAPGYFEVRRNLAVAERRMKSIKKPEPGSEIK
ncbi:tetratricopeptide repeat protein [bacterium]|nr:tetratricopeptide repeat protein [bacterium]